MDEADGRTARMGERVREPMHRRPMILLLWGLMGLLAWTGCEPSPEDCEELCDEHGLCAIRTNVDIPKGYICYPARPEHCRQSKICKRGGQCHFAPHVSRGGCVALEAEDCLESVACEKAGRCTLGEEGACVVSAVGCTRSDRCGKDGACHLGSESGEGGELICQKADVPRDEWCREACDKQGACTRRGRRCVATSPEDCRRSEACARLGRCSVDEEYGVCVAASDADCEGSDVCENRGRCVVADEGDLCVVSQEPCAALCELAGQCTYRDGRCVVTGDRECRQSLHCKMAGRCTAGEYSYCVPRKPAHCRESLGCKIAGICSYRETSRWFGLAEPSRSCVVASSDDCIGSLECEKYGRCEAKPHRFCSNQSSEDCEYFCARPEKSVGPLPCVIRSWCVEPYDPCVRLPSDERPAPKKSPSAEPNCIPLD